MVHRVEKEFQRHFEYVGHLEWIGTQIERRLHPPDDRCHPESSQDIVVGQAPDDLDVLPAQSVSSSASRNAVAIRSGSPSSTRPPGKLICRHGVQVGCALGEKQGRPG